MCVCFKRFMSDNGLYTRFTRFDTRMKNSIPKYFISLLLQKAIAANLFVISFAASIVFHKSNHRAHTLRMDGCELLSLARVSKVNAFRKKKIIGV